MSGISTSPPEGGAGGYVAGRYYGPPMTGIAPTALPLNRHELSPFWVPAAQTFDRIGCQVTTGAASALVRLLIYADSSDLPSGAPLLDAGTIDASTTGYKEITISQALPAGQVWLAAHIEGAGCSVSRGNLADRTLQGYPNLTDAVTSVTLGAFVDSATVNPLPAVAGQVPAIRVVLRAA
ncbi:MAG: hypothetical protein ACXVGB_00590 [Mycobacteriaceae bacterium]